MDMVATFIILLSILLLLIGVVILIIKAAKRQKKASGLVCLLLAVVLFAAGMVMMPTSTSNLSPTADYSDTETFAAEFCMAYMNNLKNPYSFTVKYIWANSVGEGKYEVYVKYTAENDLGGTVTDAIGTMGSLDRDALKELSQGGAYVSLHTWGSEPAGKITGKGQELDAEKIQAYIDKNYE